MGAKNKKAIFIIGIELLVIIAVLIAAVIHSHNLKSYDVDLSGSDTATAGLLEQAGMRPAAAH